MSEALARRARRLHEAGEPMKVRVLTGASTGAKLDEALAEVDAISWRAPYQSSRALRKRINSQETQFLDMHLSHVPQMVEFGFLGHIDLMCDERLLGVSTTSLTLSPPQMQRVYDDMNFFGDRVVLRPQELSNNPGAIRRLGVIAINTALEADIYGNVNSTHVAGTRLMNGIGGSGDFVRNAYLSIMVCPSTAKGGSISTIVPMVTHVDSNEHSLQILVTEHGLADLRGLGPMERARRIIANCAHPMYRDYLSEYIENAAMGHIRHDLGRAFELHRNLLEHGAMLPEHHRVLTV